MYASIHFVSQFPSGGLAEVWRVNIPKANQSSTLAVLKLYFCSSESKEAQPHLNRVAWVIAMDNPGLVAINAVGPFGRRLALELECADQSVWELSQRATTKLPEVLAVLRGAASTLDGLASAGIAHCGITPNDILMFGSNVRLSDSSRMQRIGELVPYDRLGLRASACMAPEAIRHAASRYTDQYGLAASYAMLRGGALHWPVVGPAVMAQLLESERAIIERAMSETPTSRYGSCTELIDRLADVVLSSKSCEGK